MMLRVFVLLLACHLSWSDKIQEKMYMSIERSGFSFCFRRLNATDSIGCSSKQGGNVGSVTLMMENYTSNLVFDEDSYYHIIVMDMKYFVNTSHMLQLNNNPRVGGILVVEPESIEERPDAYSADSTCPNGARSSYGLKSQCSINWNPPGTDFFFRKWNFPIILLHRSERAKLKKIISCHTKYNVEKPDDRRCALELKTPMNGVENSRICIRRNFYNGYFINLATFCDMMYGQNFYVVHKPKPDISLSEKTIMIIARVDSLSLFTDKSFGSYAVSPSVGIMLALAKALSEKKGTPRKRLVFSFLNGESLEYLGSTRLVYDLQEKKFLKSILGQSIEFKDIETIIELSQLGNGALDGKFYIHTSDTSKQKSLDQRWIDLIINNTKTASGINISSSVDKILPPSSVQSFMKANDNYSILVMSDFKTEYKNVYYHSLLDNAATINESHLYDLANALYRSLQSSIYSLSLDDLNKEDFNRIIGCLYNISSCSLLKESLLMSVDLPEQMKKSTILDMSFRISDSEFASTVSRLAFYLSGSALERIKDKGGCKAANESYPHFTYRWIRGPNGTNSSGVCWRSLVSSEKVTILTSDDAWKDWDPAKYPYWTESVWETPSVRLFLMPSKRWETIVLSTGIIVTLVSILFMVLLLKYFENFFPGASYLAGSISS